MNTIWRMLTLSAGLTLLTMLAGQHAVADDLDVSASTPEVTISIRPAGRNFIRLPALEYHFVIAARCHRTPNPASVSLSIADTRVTVPADVLATEAALEFSVFIPATQIGPVAVAGFCANDVTGENTDGHSAVRIAAVLSAQAAMLCTDDTSNHMTYASKPLDVIVHCGSAGGADET